jgi:hypothetical protein
MGTGGSFPEGKAVGRGADHSRPSSAEVEHAQSYTSTPPYVFIALLPHKFVHLPCCYYGLYGFKMKGLGCPPVGNVLIKCRENGSVGSNIKG